MLKVLRIFKCTTKRSLIDEFNEPRRFSDSAGIQRRQRYENEAEIEDADCDTECSRSNYVKSQYEPSFSSMTYKTNEDLAHYFYYTKAKEAVKVEFVQARRISVDLIKSPEKIEIISLEQFKQQEMANSPISVHSGDSELIEEEDVELSYGSKMTHFSDLTHISFITQLNPIIPRHSSELTILTPQLSGSLSAFNEKKSPNIRKRGHRRSSHVFHLETMY
jgi:hypothetical protein